MGFEFDPRELTDDEKTTLQHVIGWWKQQRCWLMHADIHSLDTNDAAVLAQMHITADGQKYVVFVNIVDRPTTDHTATITIDRTESEPTLSH